MSPYTTAQDATHSRAHRERQGLSSVLVADAEIRHSRNQLQAVEAGDELTPMEREDALGLATR
jgi:hypothetical protein